MKTWILALALGAVLSGCATSSGVLGGGRPTSVYCKGKGAVAGGPYAFQADCGEGFEFTINVQ